MTVLKLTPAVATHRGMRRKHNEDAVGYEYPDKPEILQSHGALFIVADGVGGLSAGDKASQMTVTQLLKHYYESDPALPVEERLEKAIQHTNDDVYTSMSRKGATTLVAVVIIGDKMFLASAGDSKIFYVSDNNIMQLNEEDVLHSDDEDDGALTKAIGYRESIDIEVTTQSLTPDDKILLCSDGLTRYLTDNQLVQLTNLHDPRDSVRRMINDANMAGGADNISAIVIHAGDTVEAEGIASHIKRISIRVAVDANPMMMQDVPSKPTTQIPLSRPVPVIDESLLGTPELPLREEKMAPEPVATKQVSNPVNSSPVSDTTTQDRSNNTTIFIIIGAVILLVAGAIIVGSALTLIGDSDSPATHQPEVIDTASVTDIPGDSVNPAISDNIQEGDRISAGEAILTKSDIGSNVSSFLASPDTTYLVTRIAEDSEGQLWYLLLEEQSEETGWLNETDLSDYTIQRD